MLKKLLVFLLMAVVLAFPVLADDYVNLGKSDGNFNTEAGIFNSGLETDVTRQKTLSGSREAPIIADLDGDGDNEIVIVDSGSLKIYNTKFLTLADSFNLRADERISNILAYDIDGDNYTEIIMFFEVSEYLDIIQYNGTWTTNETSIHYTGVGHDDGETMIRCGALNNCLMVYAEGDNFAQASDTYGVGFNSSAFGSPVSLIIEASTNSVACLPKIRYMWYGDLDYVSETPDVYVATVLQPWLNDKDHLWLFSISVNNTYLMDVTVEDSANYDTNGFLRNINPTEDLTDAGYRNCYDIFAGNFFTSPLVHNIDGTVSDGREIVVGVSVNEDEFTMMSFYSTLSQERDYPEWFNADGYIVSNIILMDVYEDTGLNDFCVLGHDDEEEELDLVCGHSEVSSLPYWAYEFKYSTDGNYNVSQAYGELNILTHSGAHYDNSFEVNPLPVHNPDEIITTYGTFSLSDDNYNASIFPMYSLELQYQSPVNDVACVPVDVEGTGSVDIVCLGETSLYYIDDGLSGSPAVLDELSFNPCALTDAIKQNETLEISFKVIDLNNEVLGLDNVNSRVTVYYNDANAMSQNYTNVSSGINHIYTFTLNKTISNGKILIEGWDNGNPETVDTYLAESLTVTSNGVLYGDSECDVDLYTEGEAEEEEEDEGASLTPSDTNMIKTGVIQINDFLHIGLIGVWLLIIVIVDIVVLYHGHSLFRGLESRYLFAVIMGIDIIMIILGVILSIVSFWLLLMLMLTGIILGVLFVVHKFQGNTVM